MLWLWCRPAAVAPIGPLAWEPPYASGAALKRKKQSTTNSTNIINIILNRTRLNGFPLRSGARLFNTEREICPVQSKAIKRNTRHLRHPDWKGKSKTAFIPMIISVKNPVGKSKFSKIVGYKINIQIKSIL